MTPEEKRQAEIARGAQVLAEKYGFNPLKDLLAREFDPNYVPVGNDKIDPELRRQRDEYRNRMQAQVTK